MNIVFFGNTKYSLIDAQALHTHFGLTAIVTIPDKIVKKNILQSPTKTFAGKYTIPVIEANKLTPDIVEKIKQLKPDFLVVADYRLILRQEALDIPTYAPLNVHHSLLPKYRGPAPAPTAILNGDQISGVTIIKMSTKIDDGDMLAKKEYELQPDETTDSLLTKLNELGSQAVIEVIENFKHITPIKQDETQATFTHYLEKQDGFFDSDSPPDRMKLDRMIRAYYPWPGVWTKVRMKKQETRIKLLPEQKIQVEGKKPQAIKDFINGYPEGKTFLGKLHLL